MLSTSTSVASYSKLSENAITLVKKRYLEPGEGVHDLFTRVSGGHEQFYELLSNLDFLPNSPTLMNKGTGKKGTYSACFVFHVQDSMLDGTDSIMDVASKAAAVAKWGGGVGYYLGNLRAKNALIQSVHRKACGPVGVLKFFNEIGKLITQGGRRELAQMGILPWDHPDIREFIHVKDADPQSLGTFNISVSCTDEFMAKSKVAGSDEEKLWNEILHSAWSTGDPGCYFIDTAEKSNPTPHLGRLLSTNPCGEVPLLSGEACLLGSINLANFVLPDRSIDWERLSEVTATATRFLDHILDCNNFPHDDITNAVHLTRKLGLGVMGWADMLALLGIHYDTEQAVTLGSDVMRFINTHAHKTSRELAEEKGIYPGSKGDDKRNATCTCIAPTGSISIIAGASSSIEPHYALEWERTMGDGTKFKERIPVWNRLNGFVPKTAMEISWEWHVRHQAAFQAHTDLACSKTINLPESASVEDIGRAYRMMHELGCKGGTVFRDKCRQGGEQVLKVTNSTSTTVPVSTNGDHKSNGFKLPSTNGNGHSNGHTNRISDSFGQNGKRVAEALHEELETARKSGSCRERLPDERHALTHKFSISGYEGYLTIGLYDDGRPGEVFICISKEGSTVSGMMDGWATLLSMLLQYGCPIPSLVKKIAGTRFEPCGMTTNPAIPMATSPIDYIVRYLDSKFGSGVDQKMSLHHSGMQCHDCGSQAILEGGCLTCSDKSCGWSRCG